MAEITETQAITRLAAAGASINPTVIDGGEPFTIDGLGNVVGLGDYLAEPLRITESRVFTSIESFISYVKKFKTDGSAIFASIKNDTLVAEIDSNLPGKPSRNTHNATLKLEKTLAAAAWITHNDKRMRQADFAEFIETNASDIADPASSIMIEVAHHMSASKGATFESKVNLENGSFVFKHTEEVKAMRKDGTTEVPATFKLGFTVYRGSTQPFEIEAKLRYRIENGQLLLWYSIPKLDRLLEMAFKDVVDQVNKATEIEILHGA
jgi:uncharacterized protein YfdQ (DUF2303 family)